MSMTNGMLIFCPANLTCSMLLTMEEREIAEETRKPITIVKTELDKEL